MVYNTRRISFCGCGKNTVDTENNLNDVLFHKRILLGNEADGGKYKPNHDAHLWPIWKAEYQQQTYKVTKPRMRARKMNNNNVDHFTTNKQTWLSLTQRAQPVQ